jgi:methyl-accepting chemotaxis protein
VITSVAIIILFTSVIVARVNGVLDVLRLVEAGDLTSRIRDVISPDEIGGLQTGVNSMAAHLEATVGSLQQRVADLDQAKEVLQRWANIFKHAGWGVAVGEIDGSVMVLMNPAFASMHGYTLEELTGYLRPKSKPNCRNLWPPPRSRAFIHSSRNTSAKINQHSPR